LKWFYGLVAVGAALTILLFFASPDVTALLDKTNYKDNGIISANATKYYSFTEGKYGAKYYLEVNSSSPLNIYLIPSEKQYHLFSKGESFNYFQGCQGSDTKFFTTTCNVGNYIGIILENPTYHGHGGTAQFSIKIKEI